MPSSINKIRLDALVLEKGLASSRAKAQALILAGNVKVDGKVISKAGTLVPADRPVELIARARYVSRGGDKLEGALQDFKLSPQGRICLDVGASTGGFTDCLLQHGAERVYAIDVGRAQLDDVLKKDPRVVSLETTHILEFEAGRFEAAPTFAVIDVSFISLKKVLPHIISLLPGGATVVPLVKPQFEVGPKFLKKGVVQLEEKRWGAVADVAKFAESLGFEYLGSTPSRLKGPKGNQEYFLYLRKK